MSEFEKQFPKPTERTAYTTQPQLMWKDKKEGWLAALEWVLDLYLVSPDRASSQAIRELDKKITQEIKDADAEDD